MTLTLSEHLVVQGYITQDAVDRVMRVAGSAKDVGFAHVLLDLGLVAPDRFADALAAYEGAARYQVAELQEGVKPVEGLSLPFLKQHHVAPLETYDGGFLIVIADPATPWLKSAMAFALNGRDFAINIASRREVEELISTYYEEEKGAESAPLHSDEGMAEDVARLQELASDAPVIRLVDRVIDDAYVAKASDVHFEPQEEGLRLRFRIDGILVTMPPPPPDLKAAILSRLKIMSQLDIAERRLAQDGRIKRRIHGRAVDFRVSTMPTSHGESVVLRILDGQQLPQDFSALGFASDTVEVFQNAIQKPEGIILVTGPTGSGKTTTLYAALAQLNAPDRKILTVEDPIEYMVEGINQVQVEAKIGRTFAATLRSFLRQDPDILMVGEIRDRETAAVAVEAAMTGHLVLSTLHTNDAATAITRLLEMGVEDYLIASTLTLVMGQRLVRKLCLQCRRPLELNEGHLKRVPALSHYLKGEFFSAVGCPSCNGSGYSGRTSVVEVMPVTSDICALILKKAEAREIENLAVQKGMRTLLNDGLRLASQGVTTLDEILRVTRED